MTEHVGEKALWRAVIEQAIRDAGTKTPPGIGLPGEPGVILSDTVLSKYRALDWLLKPNRDFNEVCALADLEPDRVRAHAAKRLADGTRKSEAPGVGEDFPDSLGTGGGRFARDPDQTEFPQ